MEKNEIFDTIMARTSVRSYTSQPIKEDKIEMHSKSSRMLLYPTRHPLSLFAIYQKNCLNFLEVQLH